MSRFSYRDTKTGALVELEYPCGQAPQRARRGKRTFVRDLLAQGAPHVSVSPNVAFASRQLARGDPKALACGGKLAPDGRVILTERQAIERAARSEGAMEWDREGATRKAKPAKRAKR